MLRTKREQLPAAQAREHAAVTASEGARVAVLRSISPDATPEEVAAIVAAIARPRRRHERGVGRRCRRGIVDWVRRRITARRAAATAARTVAAVRRIAAVDGLRRHSTGAAVTAVTATPSDRHGAHDGRSRRGRRHVRDRPGRGGRDPGRRSRGHHDGPVPLGPDRRARTRTPSTRSPSTGVDAGAVLPAAVTHPGACRPGGSLATIATVNDVHFGETECGRSGDAEDDARSDPARRARGAARTPR